MTTIQIALAALLAGGAWQTEARVLPVPGGLASFRCVASVPAHVAPESMVYDLARAWSGSPDDIPASTRVTRYLEWLERLERAAGGGMGGTTLTSRHVGSADTLSLLGLRRRSSRGRVTVEVRRDAPADLDDNLSCLGTSRASLASALQANESIALLAADGGVPFPLPLEYWRRLFDERAGPRSLLRGLLASTRLRQFHVGMSALDPETAMFVASRPRLAGKLASEDLAGPFAAFARALRVSSGGVSVPGGDRYAVIWARMIGEPPARAEAFIEELYRRDDGKVAYFYSAIDSLQEAQRAALFSDAAGRPSVDAAKDLLEAVKLSTADWFVRVRPFGRPGFDAGGSLPRVEVEGGRVKGPLKRRFWERVFERSDMPAEPQLGTERRVLSGAELVRRIFDDPSTSRDRFEAFRFTQRFLNARPDVDEETLLLVALSSRLAPAIARSFERAGVTDPALYIGAARAAETLSKSSEDSLPNELRHWQGSLALVEALRRTGIVSPTAAEGLLAPLVQAGGRQPGVTLVRDHLSRILAMLPDVPAPASLPSHFTTDWRLLHAISASRAHEGRGVEWDGVAYRIAIAEAQTNRALVVATLQQRATLDDIDLLVAASRAFANARTMAECVPYREPLAAVARRLAAVSLPTSDPARPWKPSAVFSKVMGDISQIRRDRDAGRARRSAEPLARMADQLLADTLPALLYAARLGASVSPPEQFADLWRRHDFGLSSADADERRRRPWATPQQAVSESQRAHVRGALLGLDIALGGSFLRGTGTLASSSPDALFDTDLRLIQESLGLWHSEPPTGDIRTPMPFLSASSSEACWCLESPPADVRARSLPPLSLVERDATLASRIAGFLDRLTLPRDLAPLIAAAPWQELLATARPMHTDDVAAVDAVVRGLTDERLEEILFSLIASGELVLASGG